MPGWLCPYAITIDSHGAASEPVRICILVRLEMQRRPAVLIPAVFIGLAGALWLTARKRRAERSSIRAEIEGLEPALARHARKTERIARQLRSHPAGVPVSLRKRAVSHQVPKAGDLKYSDAKIDVRDLDEILEVDPVS